MSSERDLALGLLGLSANYTESDLKRARRIALSRHHPDRGGSREAMEKVEVACGLLAKSPPRMSVEVDPAEHSRDLPSFTVDVLPAEAFEILLLAAGELGELIDDDPPYGLEVVMREPNETWVSFEVFPDAGSSTVSMRVSSKERFDIEAIRDRWIAVINSFGGN